MLTGGSLLVGAVGRTDLLGAENAPAFSAAMYHSLHDVILPHEDSVAIYPTHGAGSLCSTGIGSTTWSTIGYERRHDPLWPPWRWTRSPGRCSAASRRSRATSRGCARSTRPGRACSVASSRPCPCSTVADVDAVMADGGLIVDARGPEAHAAGHIPGAQSIPVGDIVRDVARLGRGS